MFLLPSYELNPESERAQYDADTDKNMLLLSLLAADESNAPLGVLNWFAVHGTSMNNTNTLISGDNKGYASYLLERYIKNISIRFDHKMRTLICISE